MVSQKPTTQSVQQKAHHIRFSAHQVALMAQWDWSANNLRIETANFGHLERSFKGKLLRHITAEDISGHKAKRRAAGASDKTIALEIGSLRALMRKHRLWQKRKNA
jgi:hypothetical protein